MPAGRMRWAAACAQDGQQCVCRMGNNACDGRTAVCVRDGQRCVDGWTAVCVRDGPRAVEDVGVESGCGLGVGRGHWRGEGAASSNGWKELIAQMQDGTSLEQQGLRQYRKGIFILFP